jgi:peptide/nickel transport system permease protein
MLELGRNRLALAGLFILLTFATLALLAPWVAPTSPIAQDLTSTLEPPSFAHPLGTDSFGRDVLSRVLYGARLSLTVALLPVLAALAAGLPLGLLAGYFGGWFDAAVMRVTDAMLSFPAILLAIAIMGTLGPSVQNVIIALALVYIPVDARLVRSSALVAVEADYILAARALGAGDFRIAFAHILPNIFGPLTVQATASFSTAIIAESTLSFLGLGSQPPTPSWGLMLNEGRRYLEDAPWIALAPGAAITLCVLAVNFLGDGLRDALDPQYRSR